MDKEQYIRRFDALVARLPESIRRPLDRLDREIKAAVQEIRLRAGRPLTVTVGGSQFFLRPGGTGMLPRSDCYMLSAEQVEACFLALCHHSVYSHSEELKQGYLMLENGHRAGVCGTVLVKEGQVETVRDISSINLRIAKEIPNCAARLLAQYDGGGILICGGPGSGKTTLLRDLVRQLAGGNAGRCYQVAVIDSRGEIAAVSGGVPMNDLGSTVDVLTGCPKGVGIEMALRTLYPEIIAFDELGDLEEVRAVEQSLHAGVSVVTTAHAGSPEDVTRRPQLQRLLNSDAFRWLVFCKHDTDFTYEIYPRERWRIEMQRAVAG